MEILIDWKIISGFYDGLVYYTVGAEQYCGYEVEMRLPLNPKQAEEIINGVVAHCKLNKVKITDIESLKLYSRNITFKMLPSLKDDSQNVWRMIIPDNKGNFPNELNCHPEFKKQIN